ncbi:MAG: Rrf2 family transcriptional regulator [Patescibacteria group bacterium]|nr:Rrf2 family transcriptional regulator [Patescibacteria group bacterium]
MLRISKQSDYGLILLSFLKNRNNYVSLSSIVRKTNPPWRFLARIANILKKEGLLESAVAKSGGYRLTDKVAKMTIYDYLEIFEKDVF